MKLTRLIPRPRSAVRRRLEQDLAAYDTPSAIADLMATVDRYDTPEAEQIRSILSRNLMQAGQRSPLAR